MKKIAFLSLFPIISLFSALRASERTDPHLSSSTPLSLQSSSVPEGIDPLKLRNFVDEIRGASGQGLLLRNPSGLQGVREGLAFLAGESQESPASVNAVLENLMTSPQELYQEHSKKVVLLLSETPKIIAHGTLVPEERRLLTLTSESQMLSNFTRFYQRHRDTLTALFDFCEKTMPIDRLLIFTQSQSKMWQSLFLLKGLAEQCEQPTVGKIKKNAEDDHEESKKEKRLSRK